MAEREEVESEVVKSSNSLVFISHDTRDAKLAEAFSALLRNVSAGVLKSFRTSDKKGNQGIEYGVEWYPEIIKNIQEASDVVCLLTKGSVNRPWILFEAGMAKGALETPILGVALGIPLKEASSGPFAQFQNCADDEESLTKLVFQLVSRIPNSEPDEDTIKFQVGKFKDSIAKILNNNFESTEEEIPPFSNKDNSSAKLFEEIKVMFKDLPSRIENNIYPEFGNRKKWRYHSVKVEEIMGMSKNTKIGILVGLNMLRDGMPWLYDMGIETLRNIDSNYSVKEKEKSVREFRDLISMTSMNPMLFELVGSNFKGDFNMFEEIPRLLMREMEIYMERSNRNET